MTDKQREVLDQCENLLIEHFDGHIVIAEVSDVNDKGDSFTFGGFNGGLSLAIGLCTRQLEYLKRRAKIHDEDDS